MGEHLVGVMALAGQRCPAGHHQRGVAPAARGVEHGRRLAAGAYIEADARQHLGERCADRAVAGQAVVGEVQHHAEAVGIAGLGEQGAGLLHIRFRHRQAGDVAENAGGQHLRRRSAHVFHGDLGERRAVDPEVDRLAHAWIAERVGGQRGSIAGVDLRRLVAEIEFQVEDVDGRDLHHLQRVIALQGRHVGGRRAGDDVDLAGAQLGHPCGVIRDLAADHFLPRRRAAPVPGRSVRAPADRAGSRIPA